MTTIRCHKCHQRAVIRMRQHRLALCKDHYPQWFIEQTQRFIEKYQMFTPQDRILVAVSGGKDSLALWDVLWQLGYDAEGFYINLGIDGEKLYSDQSEQAAQKFADERHLKLHIYRVEEQRGESVPAIALRTHRGRQKPCAVCGLIKRHTMNQMARQLGFNVLATAHNLDDEVSFLFGNLLSWNLRQIPRQSPVLEAEEGFIRKVKPFIRFSERETAAYSIVRGIEYIEDECPFAEGSKQLQYKELLNRLEEQQPGVKLRFLLGFFNAMQQGFIQPIEDEQGEVILSPCPSCGQPTSTGGLCATCRLFEEDHR
ncbi:ATP-binding protein [Bellilinea sp.]|uniref:Adenine nucleotide alpha hydrolase family protein n=1 Tax=Bellilinea caldifistulae TaxID=360411 RepID=A0A7C4Q2P3_9CHLR|nr:ATP-binding protein [Bellilinea sp.]